MTIAPTEYRPDIAIPPGETIRETLEAMGMTQAELAERMGRPATKVNEIIQGRKAITAETAIGLERVLPYPAGFWLRLERNYQLTRARLEEATALERDIQWMRETLPLTELRKRGLVRTGVDAKSQLEDALRFFGVGSVRAWKDYWGRQIEHAYAFRRAAKQARHVGRIAAWLRLGEIEAQGKQCAPFNQRAFQARLRKLRGLTNQRPEVFEPALDALVECGVVVSLVKEIAGAGVSGATRWLGKNKAHIQLSLRYKTDDQFWFTFFHEAGHVVLHGKDAMFLEGGFPQECSEEEEEASRFAADLLIPPAHARLLPGLRTREQILTFAQRLGIAPGIVAGRLQHDGRLEPALVNSMKLKRNYRWAE